MIAFTFIWGCIFHSLPMMIRNSGVRMYAVHSSILRTGAANLSWWTEKRNSSIKSWMWRVVVTCASTPQCYVQHHVQLVFAAQNTWCIMKEMWRSHLRIVVYPWIHYLHLMASCVHRNIVLALFPLLPLSVILTLLVTGLIHFSFYAIGCNNCFTV